MYTKIQVSLCAVVLMMVSAAGYAEGTTVKKTIAGMIVEGNADVMVYSDGWGHGNPDGCDKGLYLVLQGDAAAYAEQFSALVGAQLGGRKVKIGIDTCVTSGSTDTVTSYPRIDRIQVF